MLRLPIRPGILAPTTLFIAGIIAGCGYNSAPYAAPTGPARVVATMHITFPALVIEPGQSVVAVVDTRDQFNEPIATDGVRFTSSAPEIASVSAVSGAVIALSPGTTRITATVGTLVDVHVIKVVAAQVRINEVRPAGDTPNGFVELFNPTDSDVDISGMQLTGSDVFRSFTIPEGAVIAAHGYRVISESNIPGGLAAVDAVHLFSRFGVQVDSFFWFTDAATSYARCPEGTGPFVVLGAITRAAPNNCPAVR